MRGGPGNHTRNNEAHETSWSKSGSTRELQAPESNRAIDHMKVNSVPTGLQ